MVDASLNRAAEGLRTIEEVARFVIDDAAATETLKTLRHELAAVAGALPRTRLLAVRDTAGDVGTTMTGGGESDRSGAAGIVAAAAGRTSQSLRVIEETLKLPSMRTLVGQTDESLSAGKPPAAIVESIRYRFYDVAAAVEIAAAGIDGVDGIAGIDGIGAGRRRRLAECRVYGLVTAGQTTEALLSRIRRLFHAGVTTIQIRDRGVTDRVLFERCRSASRLMRDLGGLLIVNDRADIAVAADADGVHVGQDELPIAAARSIVGEDRLVGLSTHDIDQVRRAASLPVDCIGCGPVFASTTKTFDRHTGVDWLGGVAAVFDRPAFAIGGIDHDNVHRVMDAGVRRIAVSGALGSNASAGGDRPDDAPERLVQLVRSHRFDN